MSDIEEFALGVASGLLEVLEPLPRVAASPSEFATVLAELGWTVSGGTDLSGVRAPFDLGSDLDQIRDGFGTVDLDDPASVVSLVQAVAGLVDKVHKLVIGSGPAGLPAPFDAAEFWNSFPLDLVQLGVVKVVERQRPGLAALLGMIGVIDDSTVAAAPPRGAYRCRAVDLGKLGAFLADPVEHLRKEFGWGDGRVLEQERLLRRVQRLVALFGPTELGPPREGVATPYWSPSAPARPGLRELTGTLFTAYDGASQQLASLDASVLPIPAKNTPAGDPVGVALRLAAVGAASLAASVEVGPFTLTVQGALQAQGSLVVDLRPGAVEASIAGGVSQVAATLALARNDPLRLLGSPGGSRIEIGRLELRVALSGPPENLEFVVAFTLQQLLFILQSASADSFLQQFFGSEPQSVSVDLEIVASSKKGVRLAAAGGIRFVIPAHLTIAVVRIDMITVELVAATGKPIALNLAVDGVLMLGPVVVSVTRLGARALATSRSAGEPPGNLGPLDLSFGFKPPDGAGLLLDTAAVRGGGYALFDGAAGQYAGILQLSIQDVLSVTAIGLIATRMPDASKGFSLLVILTAEFPPIQLGFGFTLSGLGGILGLDRTMAVDVLRAGARTGALDSILFPRNPLADVVKVISDVQGVFPMAPGRFVIGLMARLGWGSPQIITVDLGIVVELPAPLRITLLGRFSLVLPKPDDAVVELHLDVIGIIDLGRGEISFDATLHDSRVAMFAISGDMAARIGWGANPMFAISAGGLNPRFEPPPGFPELRRLAITLATSNNPRVRLESYLATTSNSVQIGARLDVYAELDAGLLGLFSASAYLGFDALVILDPFGFVVVIYGGADIKRNGRSILSADIFLSLSGPEPWHAWGYAEVNFLGRHRIPADITLGDEPAAVAPPATDPLGDLEAALADERNWTAQLPTGDAGGVTLRQLGSDEHDGKVLAHPLGRLMVRQRVVPLALTITAYAGAPAPANASRFDLKFSVDGTSADDSRAEVRDGFAPGQFFDLSEDEKLSRPAFEQLVCGYAGIGSAAVTFGTAVTGSDDYETRVIDVADPAPHTVPGGYQVPDNMLDVLAQTGAAGRTIARRRYDGPSSGLALAHPAYRLASTVDLSATGSRFASRVEADEALRSAGSGLQVVGSHEVTS